MATKLSEREWLRPREAAEYLGVSLSTLYNWRKKGIVRFHHIGPRVVGLRREELDAAGHPGDVTRPAVLSAETVRRLTTLNDEMERKYGVLPSSTPDIREERERRSA